jgi:RHS repeat-associated protein
LINYGFDALDRMTLKTPPLASSVVSYSYTLQGLPLNTLFTATSQGILQAYDVFGRRKSSTSTMGGYSRTIGYSYDLDSNLITVTHPDGTYFQYTYDGLDRFTGILENGATSVVGQTYYPNALRSTQSRGGVTTSWGYQDNLLLASISDNLGGTASVTTKFTYNSANQLLTRMRTNGAYAYTGAAAASTGYGINGLNQYTTVGAASFSYDGRANLQSDGSTTYSYDAENRLLTASGAHTATLSYDPLGHLFQIVSGSNTTQFLYSGDALVAEYNGAGAVTNRYVHGDQVDNPVIWYQGGAVSSSNRFSLQVDHQGSVVSVADASGNAVTLNTYDEYGMPGASNSGRFQYTGQTWISELGLHYYKARFYSPSLGRFLQTDPVGYQDDLNLYAYVGDDPLDKADPTGLDAWDDFKWGLASGAGGTLHRAGMDLPGGNEVTPGPNVNPNSGWATIGSAFGAVAAGMSRQQLGGLTPVARSGVPTPETPVGIPDGNVVARGGANITPASIEAGTSNTSVGQGFSANSASTLAGAATDIKNNQVGVTTAGEIRAGGGEVHDTGHENNPTHVTVTGLPPETASKLLSPPVPNPVPKCDRRCFNQ